MDHFERLYSLHCVLRARRTPIPMRELEERLECSRATVHRTITHMRDALGAPVINAPGSGYFYDLSQAPFELPGIWFRPEELEALLLMDHLVDNLQPGVLREHLKPVRRKLRELLDQGTVGRRRFPVERFKLLQAHARRLKHNQLALVCRAVIDRSQLEFRYAGRVKRTVSNRVVSPQRVVYYRDQWYLDAWDHDADGLRTFSVDRMQQVAVAPRPALDIEAEEIDAEVLPSYGIFAGKPRARARLLFTPARATWVADEIWHPDQRTQFRTDGSFELSVPYCDPRELLGEILRHGAEVSVLGPKTLIRAVADEHRRALALYSVRET
ncbi:MAG: WYL domain-containing protein [Gammaproteobacteria bacterium]|nr:WYL domain-containing protein [Gammaproteobacteria bacterium]